MSEWAIVAIQFAKYSGVAAAIWACVWFAVKVIEADRHDD